MNDNYDVAVVGAGPAGMMAGIRAADSGAKVVLLEKNERPGRKLLLTGKGRCNLTNAEFDLRKLVENYGPNGKFLFHAFSVFGPKEVRAFFEDLGVETKIERGQRVFPVSDRAEDVLKALIRRLTQNKVDIIYNAEVVRIDASDQRIKKLILKDREITAENYIFCTGGKSYPSTGSSGDGFRWAKNLGHRLKEPSPALVPLKIKEAWVPALQGLSLKNVEMTVFQAGRKEKKEFGECLFTHFGLSGPIVLDLSQKVGELLKRGEVKIMLDLKPALDHAKLDERIQRDFQANQNKSFKNSLADLLPRKLIPVIVKLSRIDPEKKVNHITRTERLGLVQLLKSLEMTPTGPLGFNSAIVTTGGVCLAEIDHRTMKSKIVDNLFFAGEIIDVEGPTGGFNLQICWSTGSLAGQSAAGARK
ncbi:MAG: NAD(P)/FAD-dependent oxidoreductase [Candidatus Nealsonbacteria bacterium]|nr:NAD(P)/FAD-dependent oxidoreductase [Candidatus Nealsonbacteria bacterium]